MELQGGDGGESGSEQPDVGSPDRTRSAMTTSSSDTFSGAIDEAEWRTFAAWENEDIRRFTAKSFDGIEAAHVQRYWRFPRTERPWDCL